MPQYKLTYFNLTGLGEHIRMLLSYGGVDFIDNRIAFQEWPSVKPKLTMGKLPILEVDGKVFNQSRAIGRYLAKKFGLYGSDEFESLKIDATIDDIEDWRILSTLTAIHYLAQNDEYRAKLKILLESRGPFFRILTERVKENKGFLVGGKLSYADIYFTTIIDMLSQYAKEDLLDEYPVLNELHDKVYSTPKIKEYIQKRPKTELD